LQYQDAILSAKTQQHLIKLIFWLLNVQRKKFH